MGDSAGGRNPLKIGAALGLAVLLASCQGTLGSLLGREPWPREPLLLLESDGGSWVQWRKVETGSRKRVVGGVNLNRVASHVRWLEAGKRVVTLNPEDVREVRNEEGHVRSLAGRHNLFIGWLDDGRVHLLAVLGPVAETAVEQRRGWLATLSADYTGSPSVAVYDARNWDVLASTTLTWSPLPKPLQAKSAVGIGWIGRTGRLLVAQSSGEAFVFDPVTGNAARTKVAPKWKELATNPIDDSYVACVRTYNRRGWRIDNLILGRIGEVKTTPLTASTGKSLFNLRWAPDGSRIFYQAFWVGLAGLHFEQRRFDLASRRERRWSSPMRIFLDVISRGDAPLSVGKNGSRGATSTKAGRTP